MKRKNVINLVKMYTLATEHPYVTIYEMADRYL